MHPAPSFPESRPQQADRLQGLALGLDLGVRDLWLQSHLLSFIQGPWLGGSEGAERPLGLGGWGPMGQGGQRSNLHAHPFPTALSTPFPPHLICCAHSGPRRCKQGESTPNYLLSIMLPVPGDPSLPRWPPEM